MSPETKVYDAKMQKTIEVVKANFASVRAGRANAGVLDRIFVEYYGTPTPLNQVAAISSPDPRTLMIQPWDGTLLKAIEKAIQTSDLGINPQNDGRAEISAISANSSVRIGSFLRWAYSTAFFPMGRTTKSCPALASSRHLKRLTL